MDISLVICTYNRCQSLLNTLASVAASKLPPSVEWEVLVVDNNSKDQTRAAVAEISCRYQGRFRYLFEPRQGLSCARNAGIHAGGGHIIVFTDDDITVDPLWLQNLTAPLLNGQWAGAAGRIRLDREFRSPSWLAISGPFSVAGALGQFDRGDQEGPLNQPPYGANMAFRKIMFEKFGDFRTDLGRCGKSLIGNEETEFAGRLMAAGERLFYVPSAEVSHPVPKERVKKSFFRSYFFAQGRSEARQTAQRLPIWRIPRYWLREIRRKSRWITSMDPQWFLSNQGRFFWELYFLHAIGKTVESYGLPYRRQEASEPECTASIKGAG